MLAALSTVVLLPLSKTIRLFLFFFDFSADLAAVLVFVSWGTAKRFMPAAALKSSVQKGLTSVHGRAPRLRLPPVKAQVPLGLRGWALLSAVNAANEGGGCAGRAVGAAEPLLMGE